MTSSFTLKKLEKGIEKLYNEILEHDPIAIKISKKVHTNYRLSAINLYRYLLVRKHDLRKYHDDLSEIGLSGLRTLEGYVYKNIANVLRLIKLIKGESWEPAHKTKVLGYRGSRKLLKKNTNNLFGKPTSKRKARIMVTMPTEAADDAALVKELIKAGMQVARINMSHDDANIWKKMIDNIKSMAKDLGQEIKIYMDISGPKIRTGPMELAGKKKKKRAQILLAKDDVLMVKRKPVVGKSARTTKKGKLKSPAYCSLNSAEVLNYLNPGERVCFDDGKIETTCISVDKQSVTLRVLNGKKKPLKLRPEKGVNLPDSRLHLSSLTKKDKNDLKFAVKNADILGYSFVRDLADVHHLQEELAKYPQNPAIVLKIENRMAFDNLPLLILAAMKFPVIGIMIARGDLMVEIGDERIAEVQDQILWICESAHIPVIWATQVFETLAKKGQASRAEVTDAAKSTRAECVMLNKGPYITEAVTKLSRIISRMESHTSKKKNKMRPLHVAQISSEVIDTLMQAK